MAEYIEREAAREELAKLVRKRFTLSDDFQIYLDGVKDGDLRISLLPAADVAPVRHGRWVLKTFDDGYGEYHLYECDQCGAHTAQKCRNYCHNCGALMDKEVDT